MNLTYPQNGKIPTVPFLDPTAPASHFNRLRKDPKQSFVEKVQSRYGALSKSGLAKRDEDREVAHSAWKRDLSQRANGTIDPWYGCDVYDELLDYAVNFTYPWNVTGGNSIDVGLFPCSNFSAPD